MGTICKKCNTAGEKRWYPKTIKEYESISEKLIDVKVRNCTNIRKNLAYTFQYLEFINFSLQTNKLTDVVTKQNYKSFIINSASIVEALIFSNITKKNKVPTIKWKQIKKDSKTGKLISKNPRTRPRIITIVEEEVVTPIEEKMTFEQMIQICSSGKLLGTTFPYKDLSKIRLLRNKVHIHSDGDLSVFNTDYWGFGEKEFNSTKRILKESLSTIKLTPPQEELINWID